MRNIIKRLFTIATISFILCLLISGAIHGWNMMGFPYFENDEGTYFSQAYAVAYQGKLSHYTYWYDHAPLGWMFIALWLLFTGGPFSFGYSLYSGRIFMLVIHLLSSGLVFAIIKSMTNNRFAPYIAMLAFSLSPTVVYFHRRLFLDNIMTFWMLLSLFLLLSARKRLLQIILAGVVFGIAVLSKEIAIISAPAYLLLVPLVLDPRQRKMGWVAFIIPIISLISYYITFAWLKGELFPGEGHVSLIGTWQYQLGRGNGLPFWHSDSDFRFSLSDWYQRDPVYLIMAICSLFWMVLGKTKTNITRCIGLIGVFFWLFFMRGGLVIHFYFIPLIAISALAISLALVDLSRLRFFGNTVIAGLFIFWVFRLNIDPWTQNESFPQLQSIEWIKEHLQPSTVLAVDHFQLIDLKLSRYPDDPAFPNAQWFFKLELDPEVNRGVIHGDWKNIEYVSLTHEFLKQVRSQKIQTISPTISYATEVANWGPSSPNTYINIDQRLSTNGDWVKILKVDDRTEILLSESWQRYLKDFITYEGQVLDPQQNITTSEGQAYALLRSVIIDDKDSFDLILNWTRSHLQFRTEDSLFSWKWGTRNDGSIGVIDPAQATDGDIDIATALILAEDRWNDDYYLKLAKPVIQDIWRQNVVSLGNTYYLAAGNWATYGDEVIINPSYLSPAAFKLFATIDPEHDWEKLASDSYTFLARASELSKVRLLPDWIAVTKNNQHIKFPADKNFSTNFSYDAVRVFWRIALDNLWFNSRESEIFLSNHRFLSDYYSQHGKIVTGYYSSGEELNTYEDASFYGALLPFIQFTNQKNFQNITDLLEKNYKDGAWENENNYYTQNWVWLGIALSEQRIKLPTVPEVDY